MLDYAKSAWVQPDVAAQLERGIDLYKDYVRAVKDDMKHETEAMAGDDTLRQAARGDDSVACARALDALFHAVTRPAYRCRCEDEDAASNLRCARAAPIDDAQERALPSLHVSLGPGGADPTLVATFAVDRRVDADLVRAGQVRGTVTRRWRTTANTSST